MVVQGAERLKGHDATRIREKIAAHRMREVPVGLTLEPDGDGLAVRIEAREEGLGPADVHLVRFVPEETVAIEAGENAGQTVTYSNIVTDWETIAHWDGATPLELRFEEAGDGPLAVIVQQKKMGPVLTAGRWP